MKTMSSNKIVRILPSMSLDSILVSSVVSVSGPYTLSYTNVSISIVLVLVHNALFTNKLWKLVVRF